MQDHLPSRRVAMPEDIVLGGDWCLVDKLVFTGDRQLHHTKRAFVMRCPYCKADGAFPLPPLSWFGRLLERLNGFRTDAAFVCVQNAMHILRFEQGRLISGNL